MCVIFLAIEQHADRPLILLANRDEFYERPTRSAAAWEDHPNVYAGRDLVGGGTWLGVNDTGRFAAVTNYRDPLATVGTLSRGKLVSEFLTSEVDPMAYLDAIGKLAGEYSGFNLITGIVENGSVNAAWYSNRSGSISALEPGIYGLSNHLLDTPWPKVKRGKSRLTEILANGVRRQEMFDLLTDRTLADDADLPDTGIGYEKEKFLSAIFIQTPIYGTRCSTVVTADANGKFEFEERVFV